MENTGLVAQNLVVSEYPIDKIIANITDEEEKAEFL